MPVRSPAIVLFVLSAAAAVASPARVNFAKFRVATASSSVGTYDPAFATDGIVSGFHAHRIFNSPAPHWVQVRFPSPVTIGSAHLYLGLDNNPGRAFSNFKIQFRNGSGNWVDVPGATITGNTATERVVPFSEPRTSSDFRLYSDDNINPVVREIALYPPNMAGGIDVGYPLGTDVTLSLTARRPATASSNNSGNYPKNAVDGHVNNARWLSTGANAGDWLEIDLLESQGIGSAHVYSGWSDTNPITDFEIQYWNGSAWQTVPGSQVSGNTANAVAVNFSSTAFIDKVRLRTTTASTARIKEFLVFPPRAGGYPLGQDVVVGNASSATWNDFSDTHWRLKNSGPDLRLGLVNGEVRFSNNGNPGDVIEWQLLLNHRDGTYRVRHVATGLCLSQGSQNSVAGDPAIVEDYAALPWQDWRLEFTNGSEFQLINAWSGLTLRSRSGIWGDTNPIDLAQPSTGALERWSAIGGRHHPKKGLAGWEAGYNTFNATWSYSWSRATETWQPFWHSYNPMQWGGGSLNHGGSSAPLDFLLPSFQRSPKPTHFMGYNEPDKTDQANMTVANAIARWPRLEAMDLPLVAPAPANAFGGWLSSFVNQANALGYRRDYTAVHWYGTPSSDSLISHLQQNHSTFGRPVWLTEFSTVRWSGSATWTHADNWNFLAEFMWRAESLPWLKRYALFQFTEGTGGSLDTAAAPRSNARKSNGTLTPFGELYASWDGVAEVLANKAYHLHNRGEYERVTNPGGGSSVPGMAAPAGTAQTAQWFLVPGNTVGTHRIHSVSDKRPLRYVGGEGVTLGAAGLTDASVEWKLVENQYGWFFIEHPQANNRLKNNGNGTYGMVSSGNTGTPIQWRFVVPTSPGDAAPPAAPAGLTASGGVGSIALSWSAAAGATGYQVLRATVPGGPYFPVAASVAGTTWTDNGLPHETTRSYVVRTLGLTGQASGDSPVATATTAHPYASFGDWADLVFAASPGSDRTAGGNPDKDSKVNLIEFAFLSNPLVPGPEEFTAGRGEAGQLVLKFPWNRRAASHAWRIRHGTDLANPASWPVLDPGPPEIEALADRDILSFTPVLPPGGKRFFVLEIYPKPPTP